MLKFKVNRLKSESNTRINSGNFLIKGIFSFTDARVVSSDGEIVGRNRFRTTLPIPSRMHPAAQDAALKEGVHS